MKKFLLLLLLFLSTYTFAQKDCEYSINAKDSIGSYKSTQDYVIHERVFGNNQTSLFFSLINADGLLSLNVQMVQKSIDFISAKCFDKNARIYIQLTNGKVITLLGIDQETCGNSIRNNNETSRLLSGYFLFMKDTYEELKSNPISYIRIKFAGETIDYITKSDLISEVDKKTYHPNHFFMDYLKCIEN
jgi:aryl-phospho-beta-D-glucosidase BglC (GH1 family)